MQNLLLIFTKNPEKGKVKTRLAKTMGDEQALKIYESLVKHTAQIATPVKSKKRVCYATFIDQQDHWSNEHFDKTLQQGDDLGARMLQAFQQGFEEGYERLVIIGSDCLEITTAIIHQAFEALEQHDVVIGPSEDGGYYLLGMNILQEAFFQHKKWSTDTVLEETRKDIESLKLSSFQLPTLNDIDTEADWNKAIKTHTHVDLS